MPKGVYLRKNKKTVEEIKRKAAEYQKEFKKNPKNFQIAREHSRKYSKTPKRIAYRLEYRKKFYERDRIERQNIKKKVLDEMGGKCLFCGFSDYRALQIDHINFDGAKDRFTKYSNGSQYYLKVLASFLSNENKYQLLCANCNWIKRFNNNEHVKNKKIW